MEITTVPTYQATIYVGSYDRATQIRIPLEVAEKCCQEYVDRVGLCVSVTRTEFVYSHGREPGLIIGLINYPRFPSDKETIDTHALALAEELATLMRQQRVSVICGTETIMLTNQPIIDSRTA